MQVDYKKQLLANDYQEFSEQYFADTVTDSLAINRVEIEQWQTQLILTTFISDYFRVIKPYSSVRDNVAEVN